MTKDTVIKDALERKDTVERASRWTAPVNFGINSAKIEFTAASDFFNGYLKLYSAHSNVRGIPFIGDGFKEAQRKAMWGMLSRGEHAGLISVERVSAHCAAETDYHHGIGSMQGTLIGLAQDFAGSNNVNLLEPEGKFGSRMAHSAAAPRYIETKLHENFRHLFKREDDDILVRKVAGEFKIEPKYFIPVLPIVLLNGANGMGTGHATNIFAYSVSDLKKAILKLLDGKNLQDHDLVPSWNGFTGKVERDKLNGQVKVTGDLTVVSTTEIKVHELPVGIQSDKYEEILFALEDKEIIKSFKNASDDTGFDFIVKVPRTTSYLTHPELIKMFKLESRDTENLTVWNPEGKIQKYESVEKLLADFVQWRLKHYEMRRQKHIELTTAQISWLEEVIRFIDFYLDNTGKFRNAKKEESLKLLVDEKFTQGDRLLSMQIWSLTKDRIEDLKLKLQTERDKLAKLQADTAELMYRREIKELKL
jgi:DNA topoisomerase-2